MSPSTLAFILSHRGRHFWEPYLTHERYSLWGRETRREEVIVPRLLN